MAIELTAAQVQALAPDPAAAAAGRKLGKPGPWRNLGRSDGALWGECLGSALYQTQVALVDLASRCSCPSRKFPCKHGLGLLFLAAESAPSFPEATEPEWVSAWLGKRDVAQQKKQARVEAAAEKPADTAAQARRSERRHDNITAGLDQLDAWMADLTRQGLARVQSESPSFWDAQARRLVDAQAPGMAARLRQAGARVGTGGEWAARLLDDLGSLALLSHAWRRLDALDPMLGADVRRAVGITLDQAEVIAHGDVVQDDWEILACAVEEEERIRVQRAWLRGRQSGRSALVLQFAVGGGRFGEALLPGTQVAARLAFWPSAAPQRALIVERTAAARPLPAPPSGELVPAELDRFASLLARSPWIDRELLVLASVVPVQATTGGATTGDAAAAPSVRATWRLANSDGHALPLQGSRHDLLLATSGGHPITVAGEWDGYALAPLTAWSEGRMIQLAERGA